MFTGTGELYKQQVVDALEQVNRKAAARGLLVLDGAEIAALVQRRGEILHDACRIEFGTGILPKLVFAFCDSPYISPLGFPAIIDELLVCFYHFKNEVNEALSDDELLAFMKTHFDGACQGSVDYLAGTLLERLARDVRLGKTGAAGAGAYGSEENRNMEEGGGDEG